MREILMAFLGELSFESFEETEQGFNAYLAESNHDDALKNRLSELQGTYKFSWLTEKIVPQNWNAVWEAGFQPIQVADFCGIRADFHEPIPEVKHELIINPKMAFGTGHHETTFMMIQRMAELEFTDKKVFDYGCGTGVLAILASRLGAKQIDAVDIEEPAYENTIENASINQVDNIDIFHGTLSAIQQTNFDIILANINRNVILESLPALYDKLNASGIVLISGILIEDQQLVINKALDSGFKLENKLEKGEWTCFDFRK